MVAHARNGDEDALIRLLARAPVAAEARLWSAPGLPTNGAPVAAVLVPIQPAGGDVAARADEIATLGTALRQLVEEAAARDTPLRFVSMPALRRDPASLAATLAALMPDAELGGWRDGLAAMPPLADTAEAPVTAPETDTLDQVASRREIEGLRAELARANAAPAPAADTIRVQELDRQLADARHQLETLDRDTQQHIKYLERSLTEAGTREAKMAEQAGATASRLEAVTQLHEATVRRENAAAVAAQAALIELERLRSEHLRLAQLEAGYQDFRATHGRDLLIVQQRLTALEEQLHDARRELGIADQRRIMAEQLVETARAETAAARADLRAAEERDAASAAALAIAERELTLSEERGGSLLGQLDDARGALAAADDRERAMADDAAAALAALADARGHVLDLEAVREELDVAHEERDAARDERDAAREERDAAREDADRATERAATASLDMIDPATHEAALADKATLVKELAGARQRADALHVSLAAAQDRIAALNTASEGRLLKLETAIEAQQRLDRLHEAAKREIGVLDQAADVLREQVSEAAERAWTLEQERDQAREALAGMSAGRVASTLMLQRQTAALKRSRQELFARDRGEADGRR